MDRKNNYSKDFIKNLSFANKILNKKIDYIRNSLNLINTKITFLLAFVGVIIAFYIPFFISEFIIYPFISWQFWIQVLSLLFPVFSLFCLLVASWPKNYNDPTDPEWLCLNETLNSDSNDMKYSVVLGMKDVYEKSIESHELNVKWLKLSIVLIFIAMVFIFVNILLWQTKVLI